MVAQKHVRPQRVVHVVPTLLHEGSILLVAENLKIHYDYLVRMFDVNTEAKLLENPALRLDNLIFKSYVILIEHNWLYGFLSADLFHVIEDVYNVPYTSGRLLDFARQTHATHRSGLHVVSDERLAVVETLKYHLTCRHRDLRQFQQYTGCLNELASQYSQIRLGLGVETVEIGRRRVELFLGQQTILQCQNDFSVRLGVVRLGRFRHARN